MRMEKLTFGFIFKFLIKYLFFYFSQNVTVLELYFILRNREERGKLWYRDMERERIFLDNLFYQLCLRSV